MRLIDADDLIEIAEDILSMQNHKQVTIPSWLEKAINNTPTAYDVEKVVAEVQNVRLPLASQKARIIGIIRKGGVE